ncbi:MAG: hypothetical protein HY299_15070 [Verrucomicrobia bacterium]|nr:hypothetical protein [Verrucomicrobiota bacterium]
MAFTIFEEHHLEMKIKSAQTFYHYSLSVPADRLRFCVLRYDQNLNQSVGIDTKTLKRGYPESCRKLPSEWLAEFERTGQLGKGIIVVQTWRNLIQNTGCPAWSKALGVCQAANEHAELHKRPYRGISFLMNGSLRADEFELSKALPDDVKQFGTGIPVLWNGRVLPLKEMALEVADFSHIWKMEVSTTRGSNEAELARFERFQQVYEKVRHEPWQSASEVLFEEARGSDSGDEPLDREHAYLHNLVGVRNDGGLVIIVATGSLEELGEYAKQAGAVSAIIVDNGGSCQVSIRKSPGAELRPVVESYYHRPPSIAVAIYELREGGGFAIVGGSPVLNQEGGTVFTNSGETPAGIGLNFQTDHGPVEKPIPLLRMNTEAADKVAVAIANFAVVHGASAVSIEAEESFVQRVISCFEHRFRAVRRSDDPSGIQGMWIEDYLKGVNDRQFTIRTCTGIADGVKPIGRELNKRPTPAAYALGIDIGAGNIKCIIVKDAQTIVATTHAKTRVAGEPYTSAVLQQQLCLATRSACEQAGISTACIEAAGVSWPGAVRNGRAAPSKTLMNMEDVLKGTTFNAMRFEEIRDLGPWIKRTLNIESLNSVLVFNDGEVEILSNTLQSGNKQVLLIKIGSSIAGAYVDSNGRAGYLTELGRVVIRLDSSAPRHPFSKIRGVASQLIGSNALARIANDIAFRTLDGRPISKDDAGRELSEVMLAEKESVSVIFSILEEMGVHLAHLIVETVGHLPPVAHVLLRGGLMNGEVGNVLRNSLLSHLPKSISRLVQADEATQESGATSAALIAASYLL